MARSNRNDSKDHEEEIRAENGGGDKNIKFAANCKVDDDGDDKDIVDAESGRAAPLATLEWLLGEKKQ